MKKIFFFTTLLLPIIFPVNNLSLSQTNANILSFVGSSSIALGTNIITNATLNKKNKTDNNLFYISALSTVTAGFLSWIFLQDFLQGQTPQGKFDKVHRIVTTIETDSIIISKNHSIYCFFELLKNRFPSKIYLIEAASFFDSCSKKLLYAFEILHTIHHEITSNPTDEEQSELLRASQFLEKKIFDLIEEIESKKNIIIKSSLYKNQIFHNQKNTLIV